MRIKKAQIKGFRGFNDEQTIFLDSDVVLIYGLNGSGKSSFVEALEWLFFGEISRQRLSRCKSEYQYEEYLRNLFYKSSENPFVIIEGKIKGDSLSIRKEIAPDGDRFFINGKRVENLKSLNLNLASYFRPMLAQTEIKALVDSEQKDRWEQLASILGQDDLTKLRENLISLKNKKRDDNYKKNEARWNAIKSDVSEIKSLAPLKEIIEKKPMIKSIINELQKIIGTQEENLNVFLAETKTNQKSLLNTELGRRVADTFYKANDKLREYLEEIQSLFKSLEDQAIKYGVSNYDHLYLEYLRIGSDIAKPPACPFCLAKTLTEERFNDIRKTLEEGKYVQEAKLQFEQKIDEVTKWIQLFPGQIKEYLPSQQELKIISQKFIDIEEHEIASTIQNLEKKVSSLIIMTSREIIAASESQKDYLDKKYFHGERDKINEDKIHVLVISFITDSNGIDVEWAELKGRIAKKLPFSGEMNQEEFKKWLAIEKIIDFLIKAPLFIKHTKLLEMVDTIQDKLERHEKQEVTRLLSEHGNEIKSYYDKLNPGDKIRFSEIEVKGGSRRQAKLKAQAFGKEVNPVTIFSEAHTNSLALSIYFPQRVDRNNTWETVILDDPVQSMDENHSRALIDILVALSDKKQVIVLTHSKAFFKRLCARFYHKRPIIYSFYNNEERGPSIILSEGETLDQLRLIEENCKKGDPMSLETASQQLRKAIESVCIEFLLDKGVSFSKAQKTQNSGFSSLFEEAEKNRLAIADIGKLKSLLDTSSSDSHAWSTADTTQGGIRKGVQYINDIYYTFHS